MKVELKLSFQPEALNIEQFIYITDKYLRFQPYAISKYSHGYAWDEKRYRRLIADYNGIGNFSIYDLKHNILMYGLTGGTKKPHLSLTIRLNKDVFYPSNTDVEELINLSNKFTSAYLYNEDYVQVQSEKFESNLKDKQIAQEILDTIKYTPYELGVFDVKEYDITYNPGRKVLISNTWLVAAWKMWFGESFFKLVPKERILSFPYAVEIKELPSGIVHVHLFEKLQESHTDESRFRQWRWVEWIGFNELKEKYK